MEANMSRSVLVVLCVLLVPLFQPALAQQSGPGEAVSPVEGEVTVGAIRRLAELRKEIVVAEDRFLAKYNELNQVRQYTIKCSPEAATGTRFYRRACRPEYVNTATADEAKGFIFGYFVPPADLVLASKKDGFRKNMLDLARKSPELRQFAQEHQNLLDRYDQLLRRTVGASPKK
jgi:hypothetical protein